ncbi:MAG: UbiD family decarboxylase [Magnetococcales bacterium]|nr:UbiD family decarboxylase [Magnetococcales bacterium]
MLKASHREHAPRSFADLRAFMEFLESCGEMVRVDVPVHSRLEITEISRRLLATSGPAVLFTQVRGSELPVLANLFGTQRRVGLAIGRQIEDLEELGYFLATLRSPDPPQGLRDGWNLVRRLSRVRHMRLRWVRNPPCQEVVWSGPDVDLSRLPIQTCWPDDVGPLVTWPLVITRGRQGETVNIGVYRMQVIGRNRLIMRWLRHRGGAQHAREHGRIMPVAVAIGCDPATILAAVTPVPETLSEYAFAGLLREKPVEVAPALSVPLPVPARAEIVLEGDVDLMDRALEGPFGDHTGYYNETEYFPVLTVHKLTMRRQPIYLSTFTGRPPDEPAILALALNRIFVPLLKKQFPEIEAFHLPMDGCSYRVAVVSLHKQYPGHAFRIMVGIWGFLRQFLYTKYVIVVDAGVPVERWGMVMKAVGRHVHAARDLKVMEATPIDYLDFASPQSGLGSKLGVDATTKMGPELEGIVIPDKIRDDRATDWPAAVLRMVPAIRRVYRVPETPMVILILEKKDPLEARKAVDVIWRLVPQGAGAEQILAVDPDIDPASWADLLWALATRTDPARDLHRERDSGRFAIDATHKLPEETERVWGRVLRMDAATQELVNSRWTEYGLPGVGRTPF